jgi:hypothetical protein
MIQASNQVSLQKRGMLKPLINQVLLHRRIVLLAVITLVGCNNTTSVITARGDSRTTMTTGLSSTGGGAGSVSAEAAYRAGMLKLR